MIKIKNYFRHNRSLHASTRLINYGVHRNLTHHHLPTGQYRWTHQLWRVKKSNASTNIIKLASKYVNAITILKKSGDIDWKWRATN